MAEGTEKGHKRAKKGSTPKSRLGWLLLAALGWAPIQQGFAACNPWVARVISAQGEVDVTQIGKAQWRRVARQQTFCVGDQIRVEARSRATIQFHDQTNLTLDAGTTLNFTEIQPDKPSLIELIKGAIYFFSRVPHRLNIKTPFISAGIEGTEFVLRVDPNEAALWVFEGRVSFSNAAGSLTLTSGEAAVAQPGRGPVRRTVVRPRDAVQWALYYPPIVDHRTSPTDTPAVRDALAHYRRDDLPAAFASLDAVPAASRDARYFTLRAGFLLNIGRVDEARADIDQAMKLDPNNGTAYALQSVIAVTQNQDEQALYLARKAADLDPTSPVPQVALSYAYQAKSDIDKALESTKKAVELAPDDALAYARLSELELSRGDLDRSMKAAEKAASLDPTLARTQSVLGFAYLTRIDIDKAQETFNKAIELDPAAPLPRLGLGLAKIRDGDLKEGTKEIELAASLDPDNAIVRSYLGKAYFEEKRGGKASTEFAIAKELDPNDPTPYFYDAIHKQTTNRPVEALHDLQKAIELNDNRAVYRSSLLLDQDEAARSAALGRIYNDLGFQQLGLVEGWKSVNTDPSNYSAHRLLADNYAALPRHEIARVSELLQSQLLQPVNITPVQPSLGESNLLILEGSGPSTSSFNEFNPLFTRNRLALQASGVVGSNDTFGDEVTQSGVWNNFSYSLGQFHFETDGFRENSFIKQDIYNAFSQFSINPNLSVQIELRRDDTESEDVVDRINGFVREGFQQTIEQNTARLGLRYNPKPKHTFLFSGFYLDNKEDQIILNFPPSTSPFFEQVFGQEKIFDKTDGYQFELQHLSKYKNIQTAFGGGHVDLDSRAIETRDIIDAQQLTFLSRLSSIDSQRDITHDNVYFYGTLSPRPNLTTTLGISYDSFNDDVTDQQQINPKVGFTWSLLPSTILRGAIFRNLKRPLVANQTLEQTQVAGFNQFFDDPNGTDAWRYGVGLDQRFTPNLYTGLAVSWRNADRPIITGDDSRNESSDEEFYRAYIYWTPKQTVSVSAEYLFEDFDRDFVMGNGDPTNPKSVTTHQIPVTLNYYHPKGFFAQLGISYVDQTAEFVTDTDLEEEDDNFVYTKVSVGYRLPKRYGLVGIGVENLFNHSFRFQSDFDIARPQLSPFLLERAVFATLRLSI